MNFGTVGQGSSVSRFCERNVGVSIRLHRRRATRSCPPRAPQESQIGHLVFVAAGRCEADLRILKNVPVIPEIGLPVATGGGSNLRTQRLTGTRLRNAKPYAVEGCETAAGPASEPRVGGSNPSGRTEVTHYR